jgi:competence protein ComEC
VTGLAEAPERSQGADLRIALPAASAWGGALGALGRSPGTALTVGLLLVVLGACAAVASSRSDRVRPVERIARRPALLAVAAACACAAGTSVAAAIHVHVIDSGPVVRLARDGAIVRADAVVTADPVRVRSRVVGNTRAPTEYAVRADLVTVSGRGSTTATREPVLLIAAGGWWSGVLPGQVVRVSGRLRPSDPSGGDDVAAVLSVRATPELVGRPPPLQRLAGAVRARLRLSVIGLAPAERGLLPGLVDGDTSALPDGTAQDFKTAGLTHLVAVSGSNVAFVLAAVLVAARWLGLRGYAVPVTGALGLYAFLLLARPEPSVVRATLMGLLVLAATLRGARDRAGPATLSAAVVLLLMVDPFLARSAGFALSVLATAGLMVLAPGWRARLARRWPRPLADAVAIALAAQVATAPVLALISPQVGLVSVPANVLAEPAVPVATVLGALVAVVGPVFPWLATVIAHIAAIPTWWLVTVAHIAAGAPLATVAWPTGIVGAVLMLVALVAARVTVPVAARRPAMSAALLGLVVVGTSVAGPSIVNRGWPPPGWLLVACDVGQGDGLVVATGKGTAVVVDAGPDPAPIDRCLRDLGVRRVALVLLTHFHADHVEGLPGVLRGRAVAQIEVSPLADPPDEARRVREWASDAGVPVVVAGVGEVRSVGDVSWKVLWPRRIIHAGSLPNNASIVIRLQTHGVVLLLTGDVEPEAQAAILDASPGDLRADVLKVPHHGSANQDPRFLRCTSARLALVSVGVGNPYGHPAPSTLQMLQSYGMQVDRTDAQGDIAVVPTPDGVVLVARHPP